MELTNQEKAILDGAEGEVVRKALDYIVQFGEAFQAERLVDIEYCHYPAEMAIYDGSVEELLEYAEMGGKVKVPTTTSTLCCDLEHTDSTGAPAKLIELQTKVEAAHRKMGILETYTCKPELIGFVPPFGANIATVESSAIIYFNSVLGCKSNRGGLFTRYSAITGKYPLMGYMIDENRRGTHLFKVTVPPENLQRFDQWGALGFHIGSIVGSEIPVIVDTPRPNQNNIIGFGAALATSGSVTLYHIPWVTPEARNVGDAFRDANPKAIHEVKQSDIDSVYESMNTIQSSAIDFVTLGCPHYNLDQIRFVAEKLKGEKIADGVRFWICTSRMTKKQAEYSGYMKTIKDAGALLVADTCPVESHMRQSTCREYGLKVPNVDAMVTDSVKMVRYVSDLIGCKTRLADTDSCIKAAIKGRWE